MAYEVISKGNSWGKFSTIEEAYQFAVDHIHKLKLVCGDIYVPYKIVEVIKTNE